MAPKVIISVKTSPPIKPVTQAYLLRHLLPKIKSQGLLYSKFGKVQARKVTKVETIVTITSSGVETTNVANKGDYILTNSTTKTKEQYVIPKEKFKTLYKKIKPLTKDTALYQPKGQILALQITAAILKAFQWPKKFYIMARWKEKQVVHVGDYLACPLSGDEIYRIGADEFLKTYRKE